MVHTIARTDTFLGMPAVAARDALRDWVDQLGRPILDMTPKGRTPEDAASRLAIIQEMADKGWITEVAGKDEHAAYGRLTEEARAFLHGRTNPRMPRALALAEVRAMAERSAAFNALGNRVKLIDEIWVFGSVLDEGASDVGDINIVATTKESPFSEGLTRHQRDAAVKAEADAIGYKGLKIHYAPNEVAKRAMLGARSKAIVTFHETDEVIACARPCRRIFSAEGGATPDSPILPRHPQSPGRDPKLRTPAKRVDTRPAKTWRPCPARLAGQARRIEIGSRDATMESFGATDRKALRALMPWNLAAETVEDDKLGDVKGQAAMAIASLAPTSEWEVIAETMFKREKGVVTTAIGLKRDVGKGRVHATVLGWAKPGVPDGGAMAIAKAMILVSADAIRAAARNGGEASASIDFESTGSGESDLAAEQFAAIAAKLRDAGMLSGATLSLRGRVIAAKAVETPKEAAEADSKGGRMTISHEGEDAPGGHYVTFGLDGEDLFRWNGPALDGREALATALKAMDLAARSIAHQTGGTLPNLNPSRVTAKVESSHWDDKTAWDVGPAMFRTCRGGSASKTLSGDAIRMAAALVEADVRATGRVTADTQIDARVSGPTDERGLHVVMTARHLEGDDYAGRSIGGPNRDEAIAIVAGCAGKRTVKTDKTRWMEATLPQPTSATFAAALSAGFGSSWPDHAEAARRQIEEMRALPGALIRPEAGHDH